MTVDMARVEDDVGVGTGVAMIGMADDPDEATSDGCWKIVMDGAREGDAEGAGNREQKSASNSMQRDGTAPFRSISNKLTKLQARLGSAGLT